MKRGFVICWLLFLRLPLKCWYSSDLDTRSSLLPALHALLESFHPLYDFYGRAIKLASSAPSELPIYLFASNLHLKGPEPVRTYQAQTELHLSCCLSCVMMPQPPNWSTLIHSRYSGLNDITKIQI